MNKFPKTQTKFNWSARMWSVVCLCATVYYRKHHQLWYTQWHTLTYTVDAAHWARIYIASAGSNYSLVSALWLIAASPIHHPMCYIYRILTSIMRSFVAAKSTNALHLLTVEPTRTAITHHVMVHGVLAIRLCDGVAQNVDAATTWYACKTCPNHYI